MIAFAVQLRGVLMRLGSSTMIFGGFRVGGHWHRVTPDVCLCASTVVDWEAGLESPSAVRLQLANPMLSGEGSESTQAEGARTPNGRLTISPFTAAPIDRRTKAGMDVEPVFFMIEARWFSTVRWLTPRSAAIILLGWPATTNSMNLHLSVRQTTHTIVHLDVTDSKCRRSAQKRQNFKRISIALFHRIAPSLLASAAITPRPMNNASKSNSFPTAFGHPLVAMDVALSRFRASRARSSGAKT